ncbi:MAG TPA: hypothetical protein VFG64_07285 [Dongiaceae bacterium]|nr:hypothetical protein [Dongiaceae bacterium]
MSDEEETVTVEDSALTPDGYFAQAPLEELRRYVCLDLARLMGVLPDKAIKLAREIERFLLGRSLRSAEDHE